jgi:hypothetical protein
MDFFIGLIVGTLIGFWIGGAIVWTIINTKGGDKE